MTEKKSQAELEIEALADIFGIVTSGFKKFYEKAENNASGENSKAASSGSYSTAASSGEYSTAASSGDYSTAASSGIYSKAASSGDYSTAASSGENSTAASSGDYSGCSAIGYRAAVSGDIGNLIMASEYIIKDGKGIPIGGKADIVDGKKLKPQCWYIVENGEWIEVDFSDGIFSYVLSNKNGVKKVRTEQGEIIYIVSDGNGNYAHGETIKEAREDLVYKVVAKFDGDLPKETTGKEWVGIYRAVTGACGAGVKMFVEETGKNLNAIYTCEQIAELTKGRFGYENFIEKMKGNL